jgi:hypothetical protein
MNNKLTDQQIIEAIGRVVATEHTAADAVRRVRQILAPVVPANGLPDFDFEQASEPERWAYDQGYEAGYQPGYDQAVTDAIENPDAFAARLRELRP